MQHLMGTTFLALALFSTPLFAQSKPADDMQAMVQKINERLYKVIESYAKAYKSNSLTDAQATSLINESLAIEEAETKLKKSYVPRLGKVLAAKKVARYLQVENKIHAQVRYELAVEIPLAQ